MQSTCNVASNSSFFREKGPRKEEKDPKNKEESSFVTKVFAGTVALLHYGISKYDLRQRALEDGWAPPLILSRPAPPTSNYES